MRNDEKAGPQMGGATRLLVQARQNFLSACVGFGPPARLRVAAETSWMLSNRRQVFEPLDSRRDWGAMVSVRVGCGVGYAATADTSVDGLRSALAVAQDWAKILDRAGVPKMPDVWQPLETGHYRTPQAASLETLPWPALRDQVDTAARGLKQADAIVDWQAAVRVQDLRSLLCDKDGASVEQSFVYVMPTLSATAYQRGESQTRTFFAGGVCRQGGLDIIDDVGFVDAAPSIAAEAVELLTAPDCPEGTLDVVLAPDQMFLQVHESIGHPLELDRILGDERNYAGTSFVTPEMFGSYRYGSALLHVTFDPRGASEFASYGWDDEGTAAERVDIIRDGLLLRPLGGASSQARAGMQGVANARACAWQRPPIDRMANLNLEPGTSSVDDLIAGVDDGVLMRTNRSWSIDDSRNKFQFGCEWGRRIRQGRLAEVVKNPNYRGVSAAFWQQLTGVGNASTRQVLGSPYCGKGEPNQAIRVGHTVPACRFDRVDVFGGA